jgi:hypothetical protein
LTNILHPLLVDLFKKNSPAGGKIAPCIFLRRWPHAGRENLWTPWANQPTQLEALSQMTYFGMWNMCWFIYEIFSSLLILLSWLFADIAEERLSSGTGTGLDAQRHHESSPILAPGKAGEKLNAPIGPENPVTNQSLQLNDVSTDQVQP